MPRKVDGYQVFQRAHALTLEIYRLTANFPREETYGLVSQMRRAAYSIPMNLKEGSGGTEPEFLRYVRIAIGSKEEVEYQLKLAHDLQLHHGGGLPTPQLRSPRDRQDALWHSQESRPMTRLPSSLVAVVQEHDVTFRQAQPLELEVWCLSEMLELEACA